MKERPILFSAPMVRALLKSRKTQTRRVVKPQPASGVRPSPFSKSGLEDGHGRELRCPYGRPGDRLWVRETWARPITLDPGPTIYRADYPACVPSYYENVPPADEVVWKPSIHMPRSACRITLEITGVRVERLQDISEVDAKAEGCEPIDLCDHIRQSCSDIGCPGPTNYRGGYQSLWESINGPGSWDTNPWVWVIEFKRIKP